MFLLTIGAALIATAAAAKPTAPISVAPIVLAPGPENTEFDSPGHRVRRVEALIRDLSEAGRLDVRAADQDASEFADCLAGDDFDAARYPCVGERLAAGGADLPRVALIVDHPGWRSAQHRLVCIRPGGREARTSVYMHYIENPAARADARRSVLVCIAAALDAR